MVKTRLPAGVVRAKIGSTTTDAADFWIVLASIATLSILPSLGKFGLLGMSGDVESGSAASQILWGIVYASAAWRVLTLRARSVPLLKSSFPLVGFLIVVAASYAWSIDQWVTLRNSIEMIGTALMCYYIVARFTLAEFLDVLVAYFAIVLATSVALVFVWPSHGLSSYGVVGWAGVFDEKNGLGVATGLGALAFAISFAKYPQRRIPLALGVLLSVVALVGSRDVTAALALTASSAIVVAIVACSSSRTGAYACLAVAIVVIGGGFAFASGGIDSSTFFTLIGKSPTLTGRADFWPGLVRAIGDRPLLGFGYNAFFYDPDTVKEYIAGLTGWWIPLNAHNSFYQMILSVGFVGVSIFGIAMVLGFVRSLGHVLRKRDPLLVWPLAVLIYSLCGSATEVYIGLPNSIESICMLVALLYSFRDDGGVAVAVASGDATAARKMPLAMRTTDAKMTSVRGASAALRQKRRTLSSDETRRETL